VDGAAVNNMPIDLVRPRDDVGTVIAVNVAPLRDQGEAYRFGPTISGWAALLHKFRSPSGAPYAPGLVNTFMRTNEIRGATLLQSREFTRLADIVIEPPVEQFPLLQFSLCPEIIDCGYEAACSAVGDWLTQGGSATIDRLRGTERAP
jgi:predicted acylesterase/phospholipase RssA